MTKNTPTIRTIDNLGRVILPASVREALDLKKSDNMEITLDEANGKIILKKVQISE